MATDSNLPTDIDRELLLKQDRLYERLHKCMYEQRDRQAARMWADRLEQAMSLRPIEPLSIFDQFYMAVIYEARSDKDRAIEHRWESIRLAQRAYAVGIEEQIPRETFNYVVRVLRERVAEAFDRLIQLYTEDGNSRDAQDARVRMKQTLDGFKEL